MFNKILGNAFLTSVALLTGCKNSSPLTQNLAMKENLNMTPTKTHGVQVVGIIWLNPLHRKDYPTEWQTLWTVSYTHLTLPTIYSV